MNISFNGHRQMERTAQISQEELKNLFEIMKSEFMSHIEFSPSLDHPTRYCGHEDQVICKICSSHGVDVEYKKDRIAFFKAIVDSMENPYQ
jgi:hypothetical protein